MKANSELLPRTMVSAIVAHRDAALAKIEEAAATLTLGYELAEEARLLASQAHNEAVFCLSDRSKSDAYRDLFRSFDADMSVECFRHQTNARTWQNLTTQTGLKNLMDRTSKDELYASLCGDVPEITMSNIESTFKALAGDAKLIFQRGLARAFIDLDKRFRSHDGFKLGSRVILTNVFDQWGMWNWHSQVQATLADIERVFAVLDEKQHHDNATLAHAIEVSRGHGMSPRQSMTETPYFRVRTFKNGNAHLWFQRDDLVDKANRVLADYYGEVLPDCEPDETPVADVRSKTGALSKDLAFYPTPAEVAKIILRDVYLDGAVVLEPSAGTGNMVRELLTKGVAKVDAIEVHQDRVRAIEGIEDQRVSVREANFLRMKAVPRYSHVIMNPPFYGTHWMEHVTHAFDFLAPAGMLIAVLPVSAEIGQTRKHLAFRKWAETHRGNRWGNLFTDLPPESFKGSGTRVNTVYLVMHR
jgi:16S rRNA G966 N2-methylase RsmD